MKTAKIASLLVLYASIIFNIYLVYKSDMQSINALIVLINSFIALIALNVYKSMSKELYRRTKQEIPDELTPKKLKQILKEKAIEKLKKAGFSDEMIDHYVSIYLSAID